MNTPGLSTDAILRIWEAGAEQRPLERALTILTTAGPNPAPDGIDNLPVGERDARLLRLREQTFGPTLHAFAECPGCAERLEFVLDVADILASERQMDAAGILSIDGVTLRYRLPTSADLLAALASNPEHAARTSLVRRCVIDAIRDGHAVDPGELSPAVLTALDGQMAAHDPLADIQLDLDCPACRQGWQSSLDIGSFFWAELAAHARRLLHDVDRLARAYGWREVDILSMSAWRRQRYLEISGA